MNDTTTIRPPSRTPRVPRGLAAAAVTATLLLVAGCGSGGDTRPEVEVSTGAGPTTQEITGEYDVVAEPCGALDTKLYEDVVGAEPLKEIDEARLEEGVETLHCHFDSSEDGETVPKFGIDVRSRVHPTKEPAVADFEGAVGFTSNGTEGMTGTDGPWEQGASLVAEASNQYLLIVRDDNLALGVRATVEPFDGLTEKRVMELMTGYAEQTMVGLKR